MLLFSDGCIARLPLHGAAVLMPNSPDRAPRSRHASEVDVQCCDPPHSPSHVLRSADAHAIPSHGMPPSHLSCSISVNLFLAFASLSRPIGFDLFHAHILVLDFMHRICAASAVTCCRLHSHQLEHSACLLHTSVLYVSIQVFAMHVVNLCGYLVLFTTFTPSVFCRFPIEHFPYIWPLQQTPRSCQ